MYSTENVLRIARDSEAKLVVKRPYRQPRKVIVEETEVKNISTVSKSLLSNSDIELKEYIDYRT